MFIYLHDVAHLRTLFLPVALQSVTCCDRLQSRHHQKKKQKKSIVLRCTCANTRRRLQKTGPDSGSFLVPLFTLSERRFSQKMVASRCCCDDHNLSQFLSCFRSQHDSLSCRIRDNDATRLCSSAIDQTKQDNRHCCNCTWYDKMSRFFQLDC